MLFSEELFQEAQVFEQYYAEGAYFRLQQAYSCVGMSREYVVEERKISRSVIDIICREYEKGEDTIDICKVAVIKITIRTKRVQSADKKDVKEIPSGIVWKADLFSVLSFI